MTKQIRSLCLALILAALVCLSGCARQGEGTVGASQAGDSSLTQTYNAQRATMYLNDAFYVTNGFSTHLPLLVIRSDGAVDFYFGREIYSQGTLTRTAFVHAQSTQLWSQEARGVAAQEEKSNYSLSISQEGMQLLQEALWGKEVHDQWVLLGGKYDKSLLRNYLALSIGEELEISAYTVQYCEVLVEEDGGIQYQGVYLLAAPIVTEFMHMQRGNYKDAASVPLDTYASQEALLVEGLYVPSLYTLSDEEQQVLSEKMSQAEQVLYSWDYNEFSKYEAYIDTEKMYDYFILNELFGNYSNAHLPHYVYDMESSTFWPILNTDFDLTADNGQNAPFDLHAIEMMDTPYYTALVKNTNFIQGIVDRYRQLYQGVLKSSNLDRRIDQAVQLLGEAQMRDWARWEEIYTGDTMYTLMSAETNPTDETLPPLNRNTYSYDEEINKLKFTLREHGQYIFGGISQLFDQDDLMGDDAPYVRNTWMFIVAVGIVIVSIRYVRRRMGMK